MKSLTSKIYKSPRIEKPKTLAGKFCHQQMVSHTNNFVLFKVGLKKDDIKNNHRLYKMLMCRNQMHIVSEGEGIPNTQDGQVIWDKTCKSHMCKACETYNGAQKRAFYLPSLMAIQKAHEESIRESGNGSRRAGFYFVTLTQPNVFYSEIEDELKNIAFQWTKVYNLSKLKDYERNNMSGMRSIEITFNRITVPILERRVESYLEWLKKAKSKEAKQLILERIKKHKEYIEKLPKIEAVSYTHLTLPTIYSV